MRANDRAGAAVHDSAQASQKSGFRRDTTPVCFAKPADARFFGVILYTEQVYGSR